jgi:hypothetical protein
MTCELEQHLNRLADQDPLQHGSVSSFLMPSTSWEALCRHMCWCLFPVYPLRGGGRSRGAAGVPWLGPPLNSSSIRLSASWSASGGGGANCAIRTISVTPRSTS